MAVLGVTLISAHSPQAKGRVERRHGAFQNRLAKGMRLKQITTLAAANPYLASEFLSALNEQFTVEAREKSDVHRVVRRSVNVDHVLCDPEDRVVQNDWTISWQNRHFQVSIEHQKLSLSKPRITVSKRWDGTIRLTYRDRPLKWVELTERPARQRSQPKGEPASPQPPTSREPTLLEGETRPGNTPLLAGAGSHLTGSHRSPARCEPAPAKTPRM